MIEMTLSSRHRIRNSSPGGLRPSTLPLGHGGSPHFRLMTQTDVVVLDFSKAFDVVPHQRLLHKLDHYGIRGTTLNWIQNFLTKSIEPKK